MTREEGKKWAIIVILILGLGTIICIIGVNTAVNISGKYTDTKVDELKDEVSNKLDKILEILKNE